MATRSGPDDTVVAYRRLLPTLRRAADEVAHSQPLRGRYIDIPARWGGCQLAIHDGERRPGPVVVEFHGGGFVVGDAAADDAIRESLKDALGCTVVGVGYCLAPEHPYPRALDQAEDVLAYLVRHSAELGIDTGRVGLVGFSAGANLATVTAIRAAGHPEPRCRVVAQVLHYPFLDAATASAAKDPQAWDIPVEMMDVFNELYAPEQLRSTPEVSPIVATLAQLAGLPAALIVPAGRDALAAEARSYAKLLHAAGVPVQLVEMTQAHHGYIEQVLGAGGVASVQDGEHQSRIDAAAAMDATVQFLARQFRL